MLLRRESGTCNEYFIGLSLIRCQFSVAGLRGPIFNHFCNARAICAAGRCLSGCLAPLSLINNVQTEHAMDVYVAYILQSNDKVSIQ